MDYMQVATMEAAEDFEMVEMSGIDQAAWLVGTMGNERVDTMGGGEAAWTGEHSASFSVATMV